MKRVEERFLEYVSFDTGSDDNSNTVPSTPGQFELAEYLVNELKQMGIDAVATEKCYVYAFIPATEGFDDIPALGFIAHLDTSDAASGANIKPQIIEAWNGEPIMLNGTGTKLVPEPHHIGKTLITTDGTTLLGGDDKGGIAAIMTAAERMVNSKEPHGKICIAFTPDEEIGRGADFFDVEFFGADYAYTVDGGAADLIESENFNASGAEVVFKGVSAHPGGAKGVMVNAQIVAMEYFDLLPADERPEFTCGREGFFHLTVSGGSASLFRQSYIIRDHDAEKFELRKALMYKAAETINEKYGAGTVTVDMHEQYRNMAEVIEKYPFLTDMAIRAISEIGLIPRRNPIRGGTDGARLSFMGLPTPNLGYGAYNAHSEREYAVVQEMEQVTDIIIKLVKLFAEEKPPRNVR